ncbi:MAG TPA: hypothetical protein VG406_10225 [Isosphaeraceae bacterium]|jgi:hypothetical protein|nr:hypothetical protein [Isosphaeraceae bacterium]
MRRHSRWRIFSAFPQGPARRRRSRAWALEPLEARTVLSHITVTNADDGGAGSLRQAIADSAPGGTIDFASTLGGATIPTAGLEINKSLTIDGLGAPRLTISGNADSRIFTIDAGATVAISGVTIADGFAGGVANLGGDLTLRDDIVSHCQLGFGENLYGAGIDNVGGRLTIVDSTISGNRALGLPSPSSWGPAAYPNRGGGIANLGGNVTIVGSTISGNVVSGNAGGESFYSPGGGAGGAAYGGGIYSDSGRLDILGSTIAGNSAYGGQGGGGGNGYYTSDPMYNNGSGGGTGGLAAGGGVYATGSVTIERSTIADNTAVGGSGGNGGYAFVLGSGGPGGSGGDASGGGLAGQASISESTITGNVAGGGGGGGGGPGGSGFVGFLGLHANGGWGGVGGTGGTGSDGAGISPFTALACVVTGNKAQGGGGGYGGAGGSAPGKGADSPFFYSGGGGGGGGGGGAAIGGYGDQAIGGTGGTGGAGGPIEPDEGDLGFPGPDGGPGATGAASTPGPFENALHIQAGCFRYNRVTHHFVQPVTISLGAYEPATGTVSMALDRLPAGVTLLDAAGTTTAGSPYINLDLAALSRPITIYLEFTDPALTQISYIPRL